MGPTRTFDTEGTELNNPRTEEQRKNEFEETRSQRRARERAQNKRLKKGKQLIHRLKIAAKNNDQKEVEAVKERLKELRKQ